MKKITLTTAFLLFLSINSFAVTKSEPSVPKEHQPILFFVCLGLAIVVVLGSIWYANHRYQKKNQKSKKTDEKTKKDDKSKKPPDYIVTSHA